MAKTVSNIEETSAKESVLQKIKSVKAELALYGIRDIGVFGSYARGEQTDVSDIDILIDFEPHRENFDSYMAVYDILEALFGNRRIDIVTKNGLSPYIGPQILQEVQYA